MVSVSDINSYETRLGQSVFSISSDVDSRRWKWRVVFAAPDDEQDEQLNDDDADEDANDGRHVVRDELKKERVWVKD